MQWERVETVFPGLQQWGLVLAGIGQVASIVHDASRGGWYTVFWPGEDTHTEFKFSDMEAAKTWVYNNTEEHILRELSGHRLLQTMKA